VQTVRRTVRNVGSAGTYYVAVQAPAGIDVQVSPSSLSLGANQSATYTVTFTSLSSAVLNSYAFGSLTWSDGARTCAARSRCGRRARRAEQVQSNAGR
jgi:hypothetical protein